MNAPVKPDRLPLPADTVAAYEKFQEKSWMQNPGLYFERYVAYLDEWSLEPQKRPAINPKFEALKQTAQIKPEPELLRGLWQRYEQQTANAEIVHARPDWRFITGVGSGGPLEVGFRFHHLYGIPIIPGSGLKGLARAFAEWKLRDEDPKKKEDLLKLVFGSQESAGAAIFFDALPVGLPQLELDVMNPHYPDWYQKQEPPANWQSPIPIFFLTVGKETLFRFAIGGRGKNGDDAKTLAKAWLEEALREMGAGAKTSAGYGYFSSLTLQEEEVELAKQYSALVASQPKPASKTTANPPASQKKTTGAGPAGTATPPPVAKPAPKIRPGEKLRAKVIKRDGDNYTARLLEKDPGRELHFTRAFIPVVTGDTVELRVKTTNPAGDRVTKIEFVSKVKK
jgi:CRISPR-associated protein Cmr6